MTLADCDCHNRGMATLTLIINLAGISSWEEVSQLLSESLPASGDFDHARRHDSIDTAALHEKDPQNIRVVGGWEVR